MTRSAQASSTRVATILVLAFALLAGLNPVASRVQAQPIKATNAGVRLPSNPDVHAGVQTAGRMASTSLDFKSVLEDPDDPAVNLRYAQDLIDAGQLDLAAATLERILLLHPELDRIRLLYAAVLYRLGNLDESEVELNFLRDRSLPANLSARVETYLDRIARERDPLDITITAGLGIHYDSNRTAFPESDQRVIFGIPVEFLDAQGNLDSSNDDVGQLVIGSVEVRYDTGLQEAQEVFGKATYLFDNQVEEDDLDLGAGHVEAGLVYDADFATLIPSLHYEMIRLGGDQHVRDIYGSLRAERQIIVPELRAHSEVAVGDRNYNNTSSGQFSSNRDGLFVSSEVGGQYVIDNKTLVELAYRFTYKDSRKDYESYRSHRVNIGLIQQLPLSTFLALDGLIERRVYNNNDPFISPSNRRDTDWSIGLTYGVPVRSLAELVTGDDALPDAVAGTVISLFGEFRRDNSNITTYKFKNWRFGVLFSNSWNF